MILTEHLDRSRVEDIEVVERKGIGHPDTLADGIAEELSRKFCLNSLKKNNAISRYFFDKVLIYGGTSEKFFGGGKLEQPFKIVVPAMTSDNDEEFIKKTVLGYLKRNLHEFSEKYCEIEPKIHKTSEKFYDNEKASDSSIATGYYPLSRIEAIVLETEQFLNNGKKRNFLGEDIKILALRNKEKTEFTLACSFISRHIKNEDDYFDKKRMVENEVKEFISERYIGDFSLAINPDDKNKIYLSFLGSCIDSFAVGISGKGNAINGLSSLYRPTSREGVFGKNIVRHPGRIYNILSILIAKRLSEKFDLKECYVHFVGIVGDSIICPNKIIIESTEKLNGKNIEKEYDYIINKVDDIRLNLLKQNICENPRFLLDMKI